MNYARRSRSIHISRAIAHSKISKEKRVVSLETDTEGVCFACEQPKAGL
nr:MAG TPA: hypothetical protein [Caudoviricetes sp.]